MSIGMTVRRMVGCVLFLFFVLAPNCVSVTAEAKAVGLPAMTVLRNESALQQLRAQYDLSVVLFSPLDWTWCSTCREARQVVDKVRRHVVQESKRMQRDRRLKAADEGDKQTQENAKRARERRVPQFVVFDCSGVPANTAHHPCSTEAANGFPSLVAYTGLDKSHVYTSSAVDVTSLYQFVAQHGDDVTDVQPPKAGSELHVSLAHRTKSLIQREDVADLAAAPLKATSLLLVLPQHCRQCATHLTAAEEVAQQWIGHKGVQFTRVAYEEAVAAALQIGATAPYFVMRSAEGNFLYQGAVDGESLSRFVQYHVKALPPRRTQVQSRDSSRGTFGATFDALPLGHMVIVAKTGEELQRLLQVPESHRLRLVLFVADWAIDATATAFHINAFFEAARWSHRLQNVDYVAVDLTDASLLDTFVQLSIPIPRSELPFVATCRGQQCAAGLVPFPVDSSTNNLLHFVYHELGRNADGLMPQIDLTTGLLVSHKLVDRWATLEPIAASSEHDALAPNQDDDDDDLVENSLPDSAFTTDHGVVLLVTFHSTAAERCRSLRAVSLFEATAATIARHRAMKDDTRRANSAANYLPIAATFATVDGSRFGTLVSTWPRLAATVGSRHPFLVGVNKTATGSYAIEYWNDVADASNEASLTTLVVKKITGHNPFDYMVVKLTPNDLDETLLDTTRGVLLMIKGQNCPHSANMYPTFVGALAPFYKDQHKVIFATIDVESMDAQTKADLQVEHYPQFRWYGKGHDRSIVGQIVDMTPFKEALVEFVSDEMGFAHMDIQQTADTHPQVKITVGRDIEGLVKNYNLTLVLFLFNGRAINTQKFDVLTRVAQLLTGEDAITGELAKLERRPSAGDMPVFRRLDGSRYKLALDRAGLGRFAGNRQLPRLLLLPQGANKDLRAIAYPQTNIFSVISVTKWVLQNTNLDPGMIVDFNFTEEEVQADNDEVLESVQDLDHSNFVEFVDGAVDAVVLYYATWCRHSQVFMKEYAKVARHYAGSDVKLGRVDVPTNANLGHHQGIQSFPTIIVYLDGSEGKKQGHGHPYDGPRDAASLIKFIDETRGTSKVQELDAARRKRTERILQLDANQLTEAVGAVHDDAILVQFSTSWCGHCRHMELVLAQILEGYEGANMALRVFKIDAERQNTAASRFNATKNFPVVLFFPPSAKSTKKPVHQRYEGERFADELMKFVIKHDPRKPPTQRPKPSASEGTKFSDLNKGSQGPPPENKKKPNVESDRHGDPVKAADDDDWQDEKPTVFRGFPAHVAKLTDLTFREAIRGTNLALVLHYATPGDEAIMNTFANAATYLMPLHKKKIVNFGAIEAGSIPTLANVLGKAPMITMYRGFAQPEIVRFRIGEHEELGVGGDLTNVTHVLEFVKRNIMGAKATSVELKREMYIQAKNNRSVTFAVFFYAPYCQECRKPAESYDEVAQMCGHIPTVVISRIDITRLPEIYRELGSRPLPAVFVFDRDRTSDIPRHYVGDFSRASLFSFIRPTTVAKAPVEDEDETYDDDDGGSDKDATISEHQRGISNELGNREMRRKYSLKTKRPLMPMMVPTEQLLNRTISDFSKGVLVLLTASWCAHCKAALVEYRHVVAALRDDVVVAAFEATSPVLQRLGVVSVPAVVFFEAKRGVVVMKKKKKTAEAIMTFVKPLLPRVPDHDLPLYSEVDELNVGTADESSSARKEPLTPANVIADVNDLLRALQTVARPSDGGRSFATSVVVVLTTPACRGAACDAAREMADFLATTFSKVGSLVSFANSTAVAAHLKAKTYPAVSIHCHNWNRTQPLSRFTQPATKDKYLKSLSTEELVAQRVNDVMEAHCEKDRPDQVPLADAIPALDDTSLKPDKKVDMAQVWEGHMRDSAFLYLRPADCSVEMCAEHDDAWRAARALALDPEFRAAATTDFLLVDPRTSVNRPLRRALFNQQFKVPLFAFLPADLAAGRETLSLDEKAARVVQLMMPFKGHKLNGIALVEFLDRMYSGKHE